MVRYTQTIYQLLPTNRLSMSDHFVGLALKGLSFSFLVSCKGSTLKVLDLVSILHYSFAFCLDRTVVPNLVIDLMLLTTSQNVSLTVNFMLPMVASEVANTTGVIFIVGTELQVT